MLSALTFPNKFKNEPKDFIEIYNEENLSLKYMSKKNLVFVKGRSTRIDVSPAYYRLIRQMKIHFMNSDQLTCYFQYTVINASTTKLLFNFFRELEKLMKSGKKIVIHWVVKNNDDDLLYIGNEFKNFFNLDFQVNHM
ncbi:MAG: SiaC family regulatory phosphoprotein [Cyclobacteriaceae bacterium]